MTHKVTQRCKEMIAASFISTKFISSSGEMGCAIKTGHMNLTHLILLNSYSREISSLKSIFNNDNNNPSIMFACVFLFLTSFFQILF